MHDWVKRTIGAKLTAWAGIFLGAALVASPADVTFQVDMGVQTAIGRFHPETDLVDVMGSFNNWTFGDTLTNSPSGTNLYVGTFSDSNPAGTTNFYKFVIRPNGSTVAGDWIWEGFVGMGRQDREFVLADTAQTLPVAYFDNLTNNPGSGIPVTFQVEMAAQIVLGAFDPMAGVVEVRGAFHNNWGAGLVLTNSATNTIYSRTVNISAFGPGSTVPYKFALNDGATWETGADRTFVLAGPSQTLPAVYFDGVSNVIGSLTVASAVFDEIILEWNANVFVRLQSKTNLLDAWEDVPGTAGAGFAIIPMIPAQLFFRLIGP